MAGSRLPCAYGGALVRGAAVVCRDLRVEAWGSRGIRIARNPGTPGPRPGAALQSQVVNLSTQRTEHQQSLFRDSLYHVLKAHSKKLNNTSPTSPHGSKQAGSGRDSSVASRLEPSSSNKIKSDFSCCHVTMITASFNMPFTSRAWVMLAMPGSEAGPKSLQTDCWLASHGHVIFRVIWSTQAVI